MSTAHMMIDAGTVAASTKRVEPDLASNPRTRRFGINPGVPFLEVSPILTGRQLALIQHGRLLKFETFVDKMRPNWDIDPESKAPFAVAEDLTALEAIAHVKVAAFQGSRDMGFRELPALTPLTDKEAAAVVSEIFPPLPPEGCVYAAENTVTLEDGREVFACLTCTLSWLSSELCEEVAVALGDEARALRSQLLEAYRAANKFMQLTWAGWRAEMGKREKGENGISVLDEGHLHYMHQLHKSRPSDEAANLVAAGNKAQAEANAAALKEGLGDLVKELRSQPPQEPAPAVDVAALREELKAEMKAELLAELRGEQKPPKGGK